MSNWSGFSKKTPEERLQKLADSQLLSSQSLSILEKEQLLDLKTANQLAENVVGRLALPFSVVPDVLVDGKLYQVPFVTEEPSVVAAASFAAKIIKRSGGFSTIIHNRQMIGQIALYDVPNISLAQKNILAQKEQLLEIANQAYPSVVKRGGGARDLRLEQFSADREFLVLYLLVDTQEAMGANIVNTMMEALQASLEELSQGKVLMAILSNYATESLVTAKCTVDFRFLSRDKKEGLRLAEKITLASQFAQVDPYRASTHNKGIFNGVDALVLATGNDWRVIESAGHTYATKQGQYRGLSTWSMDEKNQQILGELTLPMPIATKGGSIGLNPTVQVAHDLLGQPNAKALASLIVSIGLAQNFAALKALVSTGIQAGHMKLQAKSLALLAGCQTKELDVIVKRLLQAEHLNLETAQAILQVIRQENM